jgi:hypothetical protein
VLPLVFAITLKLLLQPIMRTLQGLRVPRTLAAPRDCRVRFRMLDGAEHKAGGESHHPLDERPLTGHRLLTGTWRELARSDQGATWSTYLQVAKC